MKNYLLIGLILLSNFVVAQLKVDVGEDRHVCVDENIYSDSIMLGGDPTASEGFGPYTYSWELIYPNSSNSSIYASTYLNDTTLANPMLVIFESDSLAFELTVTDNDLNQVSSTLQLSFSVFSVYTIGYWPSTDQTEAIQLHNYIAGGYGDVNCFWRPSTFLNDSTLCSPICTPDTSILYHVYQVDSRGCQSFDYDVFLMVNPTNILQSEEHKCITEVKPNPINNYSVIALENDNCEQKIIRIFNSTGLIVLEEKFSAKEYSINPITFDSGVYLFSILGTEGVIAKGKFIKQ